jgi:PAT family beta-lactamase induction signal transducer AmpG
VSTAYFAEGMPLAVVRQLATLYLTQIGLPEGALGRANFWLSLPWNLKFLWAPLVDLVSTRRRWFIGVEALLALGCLGLVLAAAWGPPAMEKGGALPVLTDLPLIGPAFGQLLADSSFIRGTVACLVGLATLAATHDIAIDAFYMEAITDPAVAAGYTGVRNVAYRLAIVFVNAGLVWLAGEASWTWSFAAAGLVLACLAYLHSRILPHPPVLAREPATAASGSKFGEAFVSFLRIDKSWLVMLFLVTYKLGDEVLFSMKTPFLKRYLGLAVKDFAWINGIVGVWASIGGSLVSAWAIRTWGWRKAVWPLTLGMNLNILVYVWLAWSRPDAQTSAGVLTIALVHGYEQVAAGLGNAVLVVYLMRICNVRFKAAHYAIGSALAPLGGTVFNYWSGDVVEVWNYTGLYLLAFGCAIPSMLCLVWLPKPEDAPAS